MSSSSPNNSPDKDQVLHSCRELILSWAKRHCSDFLKVAQDRLFKLADSADNNADQSRYFLANSELNKQQSLIQGQFLQHCKHAFEHYLKQQNTATDYSSASLLQGELAEDKTEKLTLVDNTVLEERLAISAMSRKVATNNSDLLYALNQRLSVLNGGRKITDPGNPVAPAVFGEAVQQALDGLMLDERSKILIFKVFDAQFMSQLRQFYEQLNDHLIQQGILPHLHYHINKNPLNPPTEQQAASAQHAGQHPIDQQATSELQEQLPEELRQLVSTASIGHQIQLLNSIRLLQARLNSRPTSAQAPRSWANLPQPLIANLQLLQTNAAAILKSLENPLSVQVSTPQKFRQQAEKALQKTKHIDGQVIEIVGLLFEYMLNDEQLPDSVKALLSYLHTPFLKIALIDKNFFEHPNHPARQLLNSLVAAGERWVEPSGKHKNDVFHHIKAVVERLLNEFNDDVRLFSELAFEFNHYLRQHSRRIRLAEQRATQAAQGENKLKEIRLKVDSYLRKKVDKLKLAPSIQTLLFEPWANYLSFNLLRFGSNSEQWRDAANQVDDILWYCQAYDPNHLPTVQRAQQLRKTLALKLQAGFDTVGYDSTQGKRLLEALHQQHLLAANSQSSLTPGVANIDEVDLGKRAKAALQADSILQQLRHTEFGTWFEFNADTVTPIQAKLAWANNNTLHFMFVNRLGQQVAVKTGEQLAGEIRAAKTRILQTTDSKPFFEKAMEKVLEQLRQKQHEATE